MTDDQYEQLLAAQFAQIALLQSIEANIGLMARAAADGKAAHLHWGRARDFLSSAVNNIKSSREAKVSSNAEENHPDLQALAEKLRKDGKA